MVPSTFDMPVTATIFTLSSMQIERRTEVEVPIAVERCPDHLGAGERRDHVPRDDVGVVLHHGHQHPITLDGDDAAPTRTPPS